MSRKSTGNPEKLSRRVVGLCVFGTWVTDSSGGSGGGGGGGGGSSSSSIGRSIGSSIGSSTHLKECLNV
jgi:hypothetical protein